MIRRRFLELAAFSPPLIAGCARQSGQASETVASTDSPTDVHTATSTFTVSPSDTPTETEEPTPTPRENPDTIFVGPDGSDDNPGTIDSPLERIQTAIDRAQPGQTVYALSGIYEERVETVRSGKPDNQIVITGPPDAIYRGSGPIINHSHVHLTGLTIDGLIDPSAPDDATSYVETLIKTNEALQAELEDSDDPPSSIDEARYLSDIVIKPHGIGNCGADLINIQYAHDVEVGEFSVIGPAGMNVLKSDLKDHNSEIIYVGNSPASGLPPDQTSNVHVHHIDNSGGNPHAELVDCKTGTRDILVEFCTDDGGSNEAVTDDTYSGAVGVRGVNITVRWNELSNGDAAGIEIDSPVSDYDESRPEYDDWGTANSIYGNRMMNNAGLTLNMPFRRQGRGQEAQRIICGNEYDGETHGDPDQACPDDIPTTETIGHLGGDSPWA